MLAADKDRLVARLKQNALTLRQKELEYYVERYSNITTQASILAGFAFDSLVELDITEAMEQTLTDRGLHWMQTAYYISASMTMAFALYTLCVSAFATVYGHRLALQGPQGSHDVAVETLRHESVLIFVAFGLSLVSMIVCACAMAVIAFGPGAAAACAVFMTSLLAQAWRLCVLTSELKANHRFLQQSWHVKTKEGADFDLAKTVLT